MDFAILFKKIGEFFIYFCSKEFTFGGYTTSIGAIFVYVAIGALVISILKWMVE